MRSALGCEAGGATGNVNAGAPKTYLQDHNRTHRHPCTIYQTTTMTTTRTVFAVAERSIARWDSISQPVANVPTVVEKLHHLAERYGRFKLSTRTLAEK